MDLGEVAQFSQIIITDVLFHPDHLVYFCFHSETQSGNNPKNPAMHQPFHDNSP